MKVILKHLDDSKKIFTYDRGDYAVLLPEVVRWLRMNRIEPDHVSWFPITGSFPSWIAFKSDADAIAFKLYWL